MNNKRLAGVAILILIFIIGCSGSYANIKNQSVDESRVTQKKLINNWLDYDIRYDTVVIVFDPKKDNKKILVNNNFRTVEDQETWTRLINGSARPPGGWETNIVWGNEIREIWVHNKFYGYVTHQRNELVTARIVDENTVRLFRNPVAVQGL